MGNMDIFEKCFDIKRFVILLIISALILTGGVYFFLPLKDVFAVLAGFGLFSANILALSYISGLVINIIAHSNPSPKSSSSQNIAILLGSGKFLLLFGALYVFIAIVGLSGLYLFIGSLLALILIAFWMSINYLKYLSDISLAKRKREESVDS